MPYSQDAIGRLRDETRKALAAHCLSFDQELQALQENLTSSQSALEQIAQRLGSARNLDTAAIEAVLEDAVAEAARAEGRKREEEKSFLAHFAHEMRGRETQEEILALLLDGARRYASGTLLFVARAGRFVQWSAEDASAGGFDGGARPSLEAAESAFLQSALQADGLTTINDLSEEGVLSEFLPSGMNGPWHAFPLRAIRRPVAVLLAAAEDRGSCDLEALCVLMDITGLCIENMALKVLHEARTAAAAAHVRPPQPAVQEPAAAAVMPEAGAAAVEPEAVPSPAAAPEETASAPGEPVPEEVEPVQAGEMGLPLDSPAPPAAVEAAAAMPATGYRDELTTPEFEPAAEITEPQVIELPEPLAAEPPVAEAEPEPLPPSRDEIREPAAEVAAEEPGSHVPVQEAAAGGPFGPVPVITADAPEPERPAILREVQPLTEEEKLHADAKRFARLLASEIKLYNEKRVLEGRANRDIYVRLKRDIDRSRDMYERRVSPLVARKIDYFHDEIVRILGDNDPASLGSDYPGPRVES